VKVSAIARGVGHPNARPKSFYAWEWWESRGVLRAAHRQVITRRRTRPLQWWIELDFKEGHKKRRGSRTSRNAAADNTGHCYTCIEKFGLLLRLDFNAGELAPDLLHAQTQD
jgi:hypothetical protein